MKKIFDEEFKDFLASDVYSGASGYEIIDKEKRIFKKNDKLYTGEHFEWYPKQSKVHVPKIKMVPYGILEDLEKEMSIAKEKKFIVDFPYIGLSEKEQLTCDAYFDVNTGELVSDSCPEFAEFVGYGDDTVEEGFEKLTENILSHLQQAQKIDFTLTSVFRIMPFVEYSITTWSKEITYFYVWVAQLAIVKNPVITNKKEDSK